MQNDIAIVGAGAAAIAAARLLVQSGYSPVLLEARDRVGGRAWTDSQALGLPIDMGCAWLHSADANPWMTYAREHGFTINERLPVWGAWLGANKVSAEVRAEWRHAIERNEALLEAAARDGNDVAIADLIPHDRYRARFDSIVALLMGSDSSRMSNVDYASYADTNVNWSVNEGLGAVVAHAARGLDVRLDTAVRQIDSRSSDVTLETNRGTVRARSVIVTVPTNVLARETIRFLPSLPDRFVEALRATPLGANNKVFFQMKPGRLPLPEPGHFMRTMDATRTGSYQTWPGGQELLLAYFGGDLASELERHGELESFAREELQQMFGADIAHDIQRSVRTGWVGDPWSLGSYSYSLAGQAHRRADLSEPLHERIFYAGEACSSEFAGTVHGAWYAGLNAARRALDVLRQR